jgi:hypothetical protein
VGEIADLMIDGEICQVCGEELGEAVGYPRTCGGCQLQDRYEAQQAEGQKKVACPTCGRKFKAVGLPQHQRDAHRTV